MTTRLVELVCGFDQVVPQSARSKNISPTMVSSNNLYLKKHLDANKLETSKMR